MDWIVQQELESEYNASMDYWSEIANSERDHLDPELEDQWRFEIACVEKQDDLEARGPVFEVVREFDPDLDIPF